MNTTEFDYVLTVAGLQSFSKAAKKLCVSQPALSSYISKLESAIGARLFDRSTSPIRLTDVGREYVEYAKKVVGLTNDFSNTLNDIKGMNSGKLTIGSTFCFSSCYLPKAIASFNRLYPDVEIKIVEGRIPDIQQLAIDGEIDLFITPPGVDKKLFTVEEIFSEKVYLAVPAEWEINKKYKEFATSPKDIIAGRLENERYADLSEFCKLPFISLNADQHVFKLEQRIEEHYKVKINNVIRVSQMATSFAFANAGVGETLITETAIRYGNYIDFPVLYPVLPGIVEREIYAAYKKNSYRKLSCNKFTELLKQTL